MLFVCPSGAFSYELRIGWGKAVKPGILNRPAVNFIRPPKKAIPPERQLAVLPQGDRNTHWVT